MKGKEKLAKKLNLRGSYLQIDLKATLSESNLVNQEHRWLGFFKDCYTDNLVIEDVIEVAE